MRPLRTAEERLLPALGRRLGAHPRAAAGTLRLLRAVPARDARAWAYRHLSRPLVSRMAARLEVTVAGGSRMLVDMSDVSGRMLATSGVWEPHVTAAFGRLLAPGSVCVDVGANIGYFTLLAARLVGPHGRVHALEPDPDNYAALCENVRLNGLPNVTTYELAAGAADGEELLHDPRPGSNVGATSIRRLPDAHTAAGGKPPAPVRVRPLAEIVPAADAGRVGLVKVDVEGYEVEVLRGLEPLLERGARPAIVVEVHPRVARDAPAYLAGLAARHGLTAHRLLEDKDAEREWASHRPAFARLASPDELTAIRDPVFDVVLAPSSLE